MASINVIQARPFTLLEPIGTTETEISVKNMVDVYGNPVVMSGDIQYITLEPQSLENQEIISCTGITAISSTVSRLTGVVRGLDAQPTNGVYGNSPTQAKAHAGNVVGILSDNPQVWDKKTSKDENETITGDWTFSTAPQSVNPTLGTELATKNYVDSIAIAGAPDASITTKGVARLSASSDETIGTATITIATPAVVTFTTHGLTANDSVKFTTTGTLPTGILANTNYFVISTGLTANNFQVSSTIGGVAVNTAGTQSGVHTLIKTTPISVSNKDGRLPTQSENDALLGTSGSPSNTNRYVTNDDTSLTPISNKVMRYGANGEIPASNKLSNNDIMAGEYVAIGDSVFVENMVRFDEATTPHSVGASSLNRMMSFPIFGSGVSGNAIKIALKKNGSPSADFCFQIETDDNGSPSGTRIHANAWGGLLASAVTTSFVDTTLLSPGFYSWTGKAHLVVFAGTFSGSVKNEVVNSSNYYEIGFKNGADTTTRSGKEWNGSAWVGGTNMFYCTSSSGVIYDSVLSKTDADYTYKLPDVPRIITENKIAGAFPRYDFSGVTSAITTSQPYGTTLYVGNTPGSVTTTAGTNSSVIGTVVGANAVSFTDRSVTLEYQKMYTHLGLSYSSIAAPKIIRNNSYIYTGYNSNNTGSIGLYKLVDGKLKTLNFSAQVGMTTNQTPQIAVTDHFVYIAHYQGSWNITRFNLDLSNPTAMSGTLSNICGLSDGVFLYAPTSNAVNKYSISGTTIASAGTVTLSSFNPSLAPLTCDGTYFWQFISPQATGDLYQRWTISGGSPTNVILPFAANNDYVTSNTAQRLFKTEYNQDFVVVGNNFYPIPKV